MAIVSVCKMRDGWSGSFSYPFREGYRTTYSVLVDQKDEGPASIYSMAENDTASDPPGRLPLLGHIYNPDRNDIASEGEGSSFAICHGLEIAPYLQGADPDGSFWSAAFSKTVWEWRYQVQWDPPDSRLPGGQGVKNPLLRPIVEWMEYQETEEIVTKDRSGNTIINTSGEPLLEPPVMRTRVQPIRVVHKNYRDIDEVDDLIEQYVGTVNVSPWRKYAKSQCRMISPSVGRPRIENNVYFVPVEWRVAIAKAGAPWEPTKLVNAGFSWANPVSQRIQAIAIELEDDQGNPTGRFTTPTQQMRLEVNEISTSDYRPYVNNPSHPDFILNYNLSQEKDFNALLPPGLQPSDFLGLFQF